MTIAENRCGIPEIDNALDRLDELEAQFFEIDSQMSMTDEQLEQLGLTELIERNRKANRTFNHVMELRREALAKVAQIREARNSENQSSDNKEELGNEMLDNITAILNRIQEYGF